MAISLEEWIEKIQILDSQKDFLVIYKPEGLAFYEDGNKFDLLKIIRFMEKQNLIPEGGRIFPVHRLDKITSGILIFARGRKASSILGNLFRFHKVDKIYLALSYKKPKKKQGVIVGGIEKYRNGKWKLNYSTQNLTITMFKSYPLITEEPNYFRVFLLKPITGKTHQVRVVMKSLGSPIIGDPLYSKVSLAKLEDRTYLHSYGIRFEYNQKQYEYIIPPKSGNYFLSKDLKFFLQQLGNPFQLPWKYKLPKLETDRFKKI